MQHHFFSRSLLYTDPSGKAGAYETVFWTWIHCSDFEPLYQCHLAVENNDKINIFAWDCYLYCLNDHKEQILGSQYARLPSCPIAAEVEDIAIPPDVQSQTCITVNLKELEINPQPIKSSPAPSIIYKNCIDWCNHQLTILKKACIYQTQSGLECRCISLLSNEYYSQMKQMHNVISDISLHKGHIVPNRTIVYQNGSRIKSQFIWHQINEFWKQATAGTIQVYCRRKCTTRSYTIRIGKCFRRYNWDISNMRLGKYPHIWKRCAICKCVRIQQNGTNLKEDIGFGISKSDIADLNKNHVSVSAPSLFLCYLKENPLGTTVGKRFGFFGFVNNHFVKYSRSDRSSPRFDFWISPSQILRRLHHCWQVSRTWKCCISIPSKSISTWSQCCLQSDCVKRWFMSWKRDDGVLCLLIRLPSVQAVVSVCHHEETVTDMDTWEKCLCGVTIKSRTLHKDNSAVDIRLTTIGKHHKIGRAGFVGIDTVGGHGSFRSIHA